MIFNHTKNFDIFLLALNWLMFECKYFRFLSEVFILQIERHHWVKSITIICTSKLEFEHLAPNRRRQRMSFKIFFISLNKHYS